MKPQPILPSQKHASRSARSAYSTGCRPCAKAFAELPPGGRDAAPSASAVGHRFISARRLPCFHVWTSEFHFCGGETESSKCSPEGLRGSPSPGGEAWGEG